MCKDLIISKEGKMWNLYDYILYLEEKNRSLEFNNKKLSNAIDNIQKIMKIE